MKKLTDNPEDEIWCDKDGIAGEGNIEPKNDIWLKPCPFCGNQHPLHKPDCALISYVHGENITAREWNNRPVEKTLRARISELEAYIANDPRNQQIEEMSRSIESQRNEVLVLRAFRDRVYEIVQNKDPHALWGDSLTGRLDGFVNQITDEIARLRSVLHHIACQLPVSDVGLDWHQEWKNLRHEAVLALKGIDKK